MPNTLEKDKFIDLKTQNEHHYKMCCFSQTPRRKIVRIIFLESPNIHVSENIFQNGDRKITLKFMAYESNIYSVK